MSESYTAIFFPGIEKPQVDATETRVTDALVQAGILCADPKPERVYSPEKYAVVYGAAAGITAHHDKPQWVAPYAQPPGEFAVNDGVSVRKGFGINGLEFNMLYDITCPACRKDTLEDAASDLAGQAAAVFYETGTIPDITCPHCAVATDAREWVSGNVPAFAYLSYEFWNWPDFHVGGWKTDIPALMSKAAGSPVRIGGAML